MTGKVRRLNVTFKLYGNWTQKSDRIETILKAHGAHLTDSGAGFGWRDMGFDIPESRAEGAIKALVEVYPDINATLDLDDEEEP